VYLLVEVDRPTTVVPRAWPPQASATRRRRFAPGAEPLLFIAFVLDATTSAGEDEDPARPVVRMGVDELLAQARAGLVRVDPHEALEAVDDGALLIDIRSESQVAADGTVPGALWVARNALEWRCDPSCDARDERVGGLERRLIVMCDEGYQSSLAAATLQQLGFARATDLVGGFQAWRAAGLPVAPA
jgi:rhodanese-related sulfurtransferase